MGMYAVDTADAADLAELRDAARNGRAVATLRRRQLSQGKQALNGGGAPAAAGNLHANGADAPPVASNGQGASSGAQAAPEPTPVASNVVGDAHGGRAVSMERRRQLSQGKQALKGAAAPRATSDGQGPSNGTQGAPERAAVATNIVGDAHGGRAVSMERRRQLSKGKQALKGAAEPPAASDRQGPSNGTQGAPERTAVATNVVGDAHGGRAVSMERRRQLSQGKQALSAGGDRTAAAAGAGTGAPPPAPENLNVAVGREQAWRVEASRSGRAGSSRPQQEGAVTYPAKVIVSPTQRDQRVTGLRIGPGVQVTGDEAGAAVPVSGTQYVAADGSAPAMGAGPKVGHVRTPQGLVVSGTAVRSKVVITGDEAGEHLPITGEADQKFDDDLTPRSAGTYRPAQFPRRADPHGATAVGTRLGAQRQPGASSGDGPVLPLAITDGGLAVTGTAVGRSGRVTGDEAGVCRPITGDQYQDPSFYSSECGAIGAGTAPAAHLNRGRPDPVTAGKVTVAQTWAGQRVTGPSVEHRPNVTGDEPGSCRPVTGTPYQGPSTAFGWCEPDERAPAERRLEARPQGVAVTGDLPLHAENVTGTERGYRNDITGSSYYGDMRPAEPAGDDAETWQGFSVPVALARRLAGRQSGDARQETDDAAPASCTPGGITGSFAVGDGMVTGNNEFLFRPRLKRDAKQPVALTGEGETEGRTITGSAAAWTPHDLVTGTEGYIAAGRNPSEGGSGSHGWAGARRFKNLATPGGPNENARVTGRVGGSPKDAARVTVSGGAQG
jgi:hypothetical protein